MRKTNGSLLVTLGLILLVLAAIAVVVFYRLQGTARVKLVERQTAVDAVTGSVTVAADGGYKEVKSEVGGKVIEAQAINKGRSFKKNDPLVQLDLTDIDRQIAETKRVYETTQERMRIELENNQDEQLAKEALMTATRLRDLGDYSDEQVKAAQRTLDAVQKRLKLTEFDRARGDTDYKVRMDDLLLLRDKMTIKAPPIDGVVQAPLTFEGALIGGGQPVAIVYSNARIVSAKISEERFGKVQLGQKARLRLLTYGSKEFEATVSRLLPTADEAQRFEVWLNVDADPALLLPNSTGEVTITVNEHPNALVIPRRALIGNDTVLVVQGGVVHRRKVKLGYVALNVVEITEGLKEGEQVIVDTLDEFRDGQRVSVEVVK